MYDNGQHVGYAPSGMVETHRVLTHLTHAAGQPTSAGHNMAIQAWAGHALLNAGNQRLSASPIPMGAEHMLALGVSHLTKY
jgi:hypothetical protein